VSDLRIRRASAADLPAINALGKELMVPHAQHYPAMFRSDGLEPYWRECLEKPDYAVFVAERGSSVIGMAVAQMFDETSPAVEEFARQGGARDIRLSVADFNHPAIALYEGLGYGIRTHMMGKLIGRKD